MDEWMWSTHRPGEWNFACLAKDKNTAFAFPDKFLLWNSLMIWTTSHLMLYILKFCELNTDINKRCLPVELIFYH